MSTDNRRDLIVAELDNVYQQYIRAKGDARNAEAEPVAAREKFEDAYRRFYTDVTGEALSLSKPRSRDRGRKSPLGAAREVKRQR